MRTSPMSCSQNNKSESQYNATRGIGDLSQSVWLFGVLCVGCLASAGYSFYV